MNSMNSHRQLNCTGAAPPSEPTKASRYTSRSNKRWFTRLFISGQRSWNHSQQMEQKTCTPESIHRAGNLPNRSTWGRDTTDGTESLLFKTKTQSKTVQNLGLGKGRRNAKMLNLPSKQRALDMTSNSVPKLRISPCIL
uniref:Uncharacterized protein n=1 Tax=Opuntia streptacantha TaxID=393608 RepID=A0A7C9ARV0_OPUST